MEGFFIVTLYITRHGQTEWNIQKRMQGWFDSPLTANGKRSAAALGERLKEVPFKAAYISSSGRTIETAKLICGELSIPLLIKDQLKEINVGAWQGMTSSDIEKEFPEQYTAYYNSPLHYQSVDGETFQDVLNRTMPLIEEITTLYDEDDKILIVTHAVVKKLLISLFNNTGIANVWAPPFIYGTSLTIVHINNSGEISIQLTGDTSHLESVTAT